MLTRFMNIMSGWFKPSFNREKEHELNRARHKALYSTSGRIKLKRYYPRPPEHR